MEMIDGLASVLALVDHKTITVGETKDLTDLLGGVEDVHVIAGIGQGGETCGLFASGDDDVGRGLRADVAEGHDMVVLVDDRGGDLPVDDLRE